MRSRTASRRLPAGELIGGHAGLALIALGLGAVAVTAMVAVPPSVLPRSLALGAGLVVLVAVDLAVRRLPDPVTLPLLFLGLLTGNIAAGLPGALMAFALCALAGRIWRTLEGEPGIGMGDAKLAAAGGAWLGWSGVPAMLLVASAGGLLWYLLARVTGARLPIPFGIPLAAAIWLLWIYGVPLG